MTSTEIVRKMMITKTHHHFVRWCKFKGYINSNIRITSYQGYLLKEWLQEFDQERGVYHENENIKRLQLTIDWYEKKLKSLKNIIQEKEHEIRRLNNEIIQKEKG